jgi:Na+-driven multidrug efflux pump
VLSTTTTTIFLLHISRNSRNERHPHFGVFIFYPSVDLSIWDRVWNSVPSLFLQAETSSKTMYFCHYLYPEGHRWHGGRPNLRHSSSASASSLRPTFAVVILVSCLMLLTLSSHVPLAESLSVSSLAGRRKVGPLLSPSSKGTISTTTHLFSTGKLRHATTPSTTMPKGASGFLSVVGQRWSGPSHDGGRINIALDAPLSQPKTTNPHRPSSSSLVVGAVARVRRAATVLHSSLVTNLENSTSSRSRLASPFHRRGQDGEHRQRQQRQQQQPPPRRIQLLQIKDKTKSNKQTSDLSLSESTTSPTTAVSSLPSYKELILFTTATMIIWLSEPLLSLVDTIFVGWTYRGATAAATVTQMAALGPATLLYDSALYLSFFLPIATTNTLAPLLAMQKQKLQEQRRIQQRRQVQQHDGSALVAATAVTATPTTTTTNIHYQLRQSTSHVLGVGLVLGLSVMLLLYSVGPRLIHRMVHGAAGLAGTSAAATATNNLVLERSAQSYLWIRALAAPMSVMGFVSQSICFTCLDTFTPAMAVLAASLVNLVGDALLCPQYGIVGAAVASAFATLTSSSILFLKVRQTTRQWKQQQEHEEDLQFLQAAEEEDDEREAGLHLSLLSASDSTATATTTVVEEHLDKTLLTVDQVHEEEAMTAGFVPRYMGNSTHDDDAWITRMAASTTATMASAATMEITTTDDGAAGSHASSATTAVTTTTTTSHVPFVSLPDRKSFLDLVKLSGPIFLVMMSQVTCYNIGTLRVPEFGIVTLAAHNIMMRIFFFFAYIGDAIGQAALCFYPQVSKPQRRPLLKRLFILSIATGVLSSLGAVGLLERFGFLLTKDVSIRTVLATHGQYIGWAILLHPFAMLLEGTLMAQRYFKRLLRSYSLSVAVHMGIVLFSPWTASFQHLWRATFVYEAIRLLQFASAELWFTTGRDKVKTLFRRRQQHSSSSSSSSSTVPS